MDKTTLKKWIARYCITNKLEPSQALGDFPIWGIFPIITACKILKSAVLVTRVNSQQQAQKVASCHFAKRAKNAEKYLNY